DAAGRWAPFCDSTGGRLPLVCAMNRTGATEAGGQLCSVSTQEGDALLSGTRPGAAGPPMLTLLHRERTPNPATGRRRPRGTVATEAVGKLCSFSTKEGDALLSGTRPGADGLLMLPFLNGERTPNLPNGRGSLFGMTATNFTVANLYRAAMEGAVYSLKNGYD